MFKPIKVKLWILSKLITTIYTLHRIISFTFWKYRKTYVYNVVLNDIDCLFDIVFEEFIREYLAYLTSL